MRSFSGWVGALSVAVVVGLASDAPAGLIVTLRDGLDGYAGTQDATIMENSGDTVFDYLSDGGRFVQESWGSTLPPYDTTVRWSTGLLRFDNIFASVPAGWTIGSASLSVWVTNQIEGAHLATMISSWDESTITWNGFGSGSPEFGGGVTPGVEADSTLLSLGTIGPAPWPTKVDIDVTSSVLSWRNNPGTNHGWAFLRDDENKGLFVASEDTVDVTQRPTLTMTVYVPEPSSAFITLLGLLAVVCGRRRRVR